MGVSAKQRDAILRWFEIDPDAPEFRAQLGEMLLAFERDHGLAPAPAKKGTRRPGRPKKWTDEQLLHLWAEVFILRRFYKGGLDKFLAVDGMAEAIRDRVPAARDREATLDQLIKLANGAHRRDKSGREMTKLFGTKARPITPGGFATWRRVPPAF